MVTKLNQKPMSGPLTELPILNSAGFKNWSYDEDYNKRQRFSWIYFPFVLVFIELRLFSKTIINFQSMHLDPDDAIFMLPHDLTDNSII